MTVEILTQRTRILQQMATLHPMAMGSLKAEYREGPGGERRGPYYQHQMWHEGANVTRRVPAEEAPALAEAIARRQEFEALAMQFIELSAGFTTSTVAAAQKKESPDCALAQEAEIAELMARFVAQPPSGRAVQELEGLVRAAIFKPATSLVGWLLQQAAERVDAGYQPKIGEYRKGREKRQVQCLFGCFELERDYYHHPGKQQGHCPADAGLGLEAGYTPALARLICLEGADEPGFERAQRHLAETGGIVVSARQIQRVVQRVGEDAQAWQSREGGSGETASVPILYVSADGTGIPMRPEELVGRKGKQPDGTAKTRQVYLGCTFTQHGRDEKGHPVRDPDSTTYVSGLQSIDEFGPCLRREALRRGMGAAQQVVVLIDGAAGLANMGRQNFPGALQIVDFFHALEHAGQIVAAQVGKEHPEYKARLALWARNLLKDRVSQLVDQTRLASQGQTCAGAVEAELGYFERNQDRMQYGTFRRKGFFIGSGVVEAGCKTVIGGRCKQSGMHWSKPGAQNILALRCIHRSRRLDSFWKHRLDHHAARNDVIQLHE